MNQVLPVKCPKCGFRLCALEGGEIYCPDCEAKDLMEALAAQAKGRTWAIDLKGLPQG